nr:MAG TPA: hypothetical protein [Caudoviricetes sp.]
MKLSLVFELFNDEQVENIIHITLFVPVTLSELY